MPYFESFDKTRIYYESCTGSLPHTLVILHGWAVGRMEGYESFRRYLNDFNLFFWDARNHGKSVAQPKATIADLASDLRFFLTNIYNQPYPVTVIGHSMGALTLFEYISRYKTDRISKMVIIDQSPRLLTDKDWKLGIFGDWPAQKNEALIAALCSNIGGGLAFFSRYFLNKDFFPFTLSQSRFFGENMPNVPDDAARGLVSIWRSLTAKDFRPFIPQIDIPTLLLYGEKSQFYLRQTGEWMNNNIAGSRLILFPEGNHSPFIAEPGLFFQSIREFVLE